MKTTNDYLSYSRAHLFLNDKLSFFRKYILKDLGPKKSPTIFDKFHESAKPFFKGDKDWSPFKKPDKPTQQEVHIFRALNSLSDVCRLSQNLNIKEALQQGEYEKEIVSVPNKLRGFVDVFHEDTIIDFKGEMLQSIKLKKFKYALQESVYRMIMNDNMIMLKDFIFISVKLSQPYTVSIFNFPGGWCVEVMRALQDLIIPQYERYMKKVKKLFGDDIFERNLKPAERFDVFEKGARAKLFPIRQMIVPKDWEYLHLKDGDLKENKDEVSDID